MIADILLVKYKADNTTIDDVIICESKLSAGTDYTKRQKQGWRLIARGENLVVKANKLNSVLDNNGKIVDGNITLTAQNPTTSFVIEILKSKKIYDSGSKDGPLNISSIPVNQFINFTTKN